ncbi:MAG: ubiquinol-cytochrome c reductase iron-sulfur subunit [Pseudomonadales bacterium]
MSANGVNEGRRRFLIGATSAVGAAGVVGAAVPFVKSWSPSARARALGAPIKVDISRLKPGEMLGPMPAWRGKPVFVLRRTGEALELMNTLVPELADPDSQEPMQPRYAQNAHRSRDPEIGVLLGLCTHLGCSPKFYGEVQPESFDPRWKGGFFCPCHGSKFDLAGRVYSGYPAPSNLEVPPYSYESESVIIIGVDEENA